MKKQYLLPVAISALCTPQVFASSDEETIQQPKQVVIASRYEQSQDEIIPSVTVIEREDILNLQANNIIDILSLQQGIDISRNGGAGSTTSIFMRGTNSNHTLVLIDGMRVGSAASGSFAWEHLPVSQIERIEIVRGTRVSYYGADAIGGVINIITRKQNGLYAKITAGSYGTENYNLAYGNSGDRFDYSLSLGYKSVDGFSATNENNVFAYNPDDDSYENKNINFNSSIKFESGKINLSYFDVDAGIDFDSAFNVGHSENREKVSRISWDGAFWGGWSSQIAFGKNINSIKTKAFSDEYNSDRLSFDFLLDKEMQNHHFGLGFTYREEDASYIQHLTDFLSYRESRKNKALFANWQGNFDRNILSVSGRYDDNNIYGSNSTFDFDWAFSITENTRLNVSAGTAFHAPDFNALFSPSGQVIVFSPVLNEYIFLFSFEGNPDLKPEESLNYELGISTKISQSQNFSVNSFYYEVDNLVDYMPPTYKPVNINNATIKGLEADYNLNLETVSLNINATIQDTQNDETGETLLRRPDNKFSVNLDKYFNHFSLGSSLRYASGREDFDATLASYTVWDLRAAYRFNDHWRLALKLENITDEDYQLANGYNTPGASGFLTLEWQQ